MKNLIYSNDFIGYFFGTNDYALITVCLIYGCIGMFMMMLVDIMGRDKKSSYSPEAFDLGWFLKDNAPRFLFNLLIMLVCIRFCSDFIHEPTTPKSSVLIGFFSDVIALMVKKRKQKAWNDAESGKLTSFRSAIETNDNGDKFKQEISKALTEALTETVSDSQIKNKQKDDTDKDN